jgi:hypothetical protein
LINEWFPHPGYEQIDEEQIKKLDIRKSLNLIINEKSINANNKGWALIEKVEEDLIKNNMIFISFSFINIFINSNPFFISIPIPIQYRKC